MYLFKSNNIIKCICMYSSNVIKHIFIIKVLTYLFCHNNNNEIDFISIIKKKNRHTCVINCINIYKIAIK